MLIAQFSDTHIRSKAPNAYDVVDSAQILSQAVDTLHGLETAPDVLLLTGDLTDCGLVEEYQHLCELLESVSVPMFMVPGNHDRRENLLEVFPEYETLVESADSLRYVVEGLPLRLIGLDTVVPGQPHGEIGEAQLDWLDERLCEVPGHPAVVFMHHPPFMTGIAGMDRIACRDGAQLGKIVRHHPQVERVLCGHVHRPIQTDWHGTRACIAPSTAHQLLLDLQDDVPERFTLEPPGFMLHCWREGQGTGTYTCVGGGYPGPFEFVMD